MFNNWKTSLAGVALLLNFAVGGIQNPTKFSDPTNLTNLLGGIGLILSKDHNVTGGTKLQ